MNRRRGSGEWITSARHVGLWLLRVWIVVGWLLVVPGWLYLRSHA